MPRTHIVTEGDGLTSIAERSGFSPDRIWHDPANAQLRQRRPDPEILAEGDAIVIPDKVEKTASVATGKRHRFRRIGVPALFSLRLADADGPLANQSYTMQIGDRSYNGTTDANGVLRRYVPADAREALLVIAGSRLKIEIGAMEPLDTIAGAQMRLNNLGYGCGEPDGEVDDELRAAVRRFQSSRDLEATGELDDATLRALGDAHDVHEGQPEAT